MGGGGSRAVNNEADCADNYDSHYYHIYYIRSFYPSKNSANKGRENSRFRTAVIYTIKYCLSSSKNKYNFFYIKYLFVGGNIIFRYT